MYDTLIIGGDHQNTLGVIEALGQKNILSNVIILCNNPSSFVLKSKYVRQGWTCSNEEDVLKCIQINFPHKKNRTIAFACSDDAAFILDNNYEKLKHLIIIPTIKFPGTLISWTDKEKMTETAKSLGITVPASWVICDKHIPKDLIYPCVIKPITSVHHGKAGFAKCFNKEELQSYLDAKIDCEPIQVQQLINKDFEFQFLGCSLNGGETIIIPGRTHIKTTTRFNNLVFLKYDICEPSFGRAIEQSKSFIRETGYSGLFSIEYMRGKDGNDYFLEMNFRNDGNGIAVTSSGTNLPFIWYLYNSGGDYHKEIKGSSVKTTYMMPEYSFFMSMLNGDVSFREWFSNLKKTNCYLTRFKDDMQPYKTFIYSRRKTILMNSLKFLLIKLHIYPILKRIKQI